MNNRHFRLHELIELDLYSALYFIRSISDCCVIFDADPSSMAAPPSSSLLIDNVNKILSTFVPANHRRDSNQLYASIGVKSHGTITCRSSNTPLHINRLNLVFFFKVPDNKSNRAEFIRVPLDASVAHCKELLNRQWCNGVSSSRVRKTLSACR